MYYNYPVLLPAFSNREDFLLIAAIFDNDTNEAVNLASILKQSAGPYTASFWTVAVAGIYTSSNTTLTIPDYPITDELSLITLTVETGLTIVTGDPVQIIDSINDQNQMIGYVISYTAATGVLVVQVGLTFQFEIRAQAPAGAAGLMGGYDYAPSYDYGGVTYSPYDGPPVLTAALGSGVSIIDIGYYQILITESLTRRLTHKTYQASLTVTNSVDTRQVFIGKLPELSGGVTI
jgi:hypothetical protein